MLRLDRVGTIRRGIPVAPPIVRHDGESDASLQFRQEHARVLDGITIDVRMCDRATVLVWNDDSFRRLQRVRRSEENPMSEQEYREMRAALREVVTAGVAAVHGVEVGGKDLSTLPSEEIAKALDECSMDTLLADVVVACIRAQSLSDQEKKAYESSLSRAASGSQTGAQ